MESYDEYARRAKLLAGVHGLKCWSSGLYNNNTNDGSGGKSDSMDVEGGKDVDNGPTSSNLLCSSSSSANNENVKSANKGSRSNIVRANSKVLDKKSKKKSLKRL